MVAESFLALSLTRSTATETFHGCWQTRRIADLYVS